MTSFWPFEITTPHVIYALLGGFIVLFGMFSLLLRERLYIGEAIWAFVFGIIIGPYGANVFNPRSWGGDGDESTNVITLEFTRVVLAIGVFAIGVELPKAYMARHWKSLFFLLVPVMTWGWFVSAAFIYALIPGLNFLSSLAVAACLTPTDPILAAAVVGGKWADKHVPSHIRHLLAAESGCNDGAAFPFLFLALYLMIDSPNVGSAVRDWFLLLWLYQVIMGAVIGCVLGFGFRHLMKYCEKHDLIDRHSYVAQYVSLAILTIGVCTLLGSDDLLAAFFCGTAFAWDGFFNRQTEESVFSSVIDTLFNVAAFIFVGAWMPFNKFQDEALTLSVWRLVVIAILVLIFRRLPIIMALYKWIPDIKTFREALFSGHFGPIGIGAVFISTLAIEVLHRAHKEGDHQIEILMETIQPIVAFMVLTSILVHGLSVPSFSLGRRVHSVSRTWSRRDTMTSNTPEWANQARIVRRGEDIVINRDQPDLERGRVEFEKTTTEVSIPETELNEKRQDSEISEDTRVDSAATTPPQLHQIRREESPGREEPRKRHLTSG
ncbi:Sodium/hydrogen exchanger family-domain-containing protein [Panaeolus papilionaceus]|nr:Sodium/hydrogen exchanger family-domain-containing protein [Panaeolus papilionaceus]